METALVPLHLPSAERAAKAQAALAELGLADRGKHLPAELSGGEQQRVAIARALVRSPRVILADEPTGNLDERTRDEIIALLKGLWESRGQTIIVVTHDTQVAAPASRRFLLDDGAVIERRSSRRPSGGRERSEGLSGRRAGRRCETPPAAHERLADRL